MGDVRTGKQARALPEVSSAFWTERVEMLQDGTKVIHREPRMFFGGGIDGDDIILFVDDDGISKQVIETEDGPAKTPFYF